MPGPESRIRAIRADANDTAIVVSPVDHPPSRRSLMKYYVPSIGNHGHSVITAPPVPLTNQVSASETRQNHVAMTHYAPMISRWRLLISSRKRPASLINPASAARESHSNPRQEPPPRAALQVDNCTLSTVEHQSTSQGPPRLPHTLTRAEASVMQISLGGAWLKAYRR